MVQGCVGPEHCRCTPGVGLGVRTPPIHSAGRPRLGRGRWARGGLGLAHLGAPAS